MMKERRKDDTVEDKIGWYYRHWKGMNIEKDKVKTFSLEPWDEQCQKDDLLQKFLHPAATNQPYKRQKTEPAQTAEAPTEVAGTAAVEEANGAAE